MIFRLGELFCGPGGIAKEATSANINNPKWGIIHQWANDYDKDTCKTYIRNICHDRPDSVVCGDIRTLDFERLYQLDICKVSLLTADGKETGFGSDLNWGIRQNGTKRNRDQAYIPYNSQDKKDGFFPLKQNINIKHNPLFKVVPKDFPPFLMRVAQA